MQRLLRPRLRWAAAFGAAVVGVALLNVGVYYLVMRGDPAFFFKPASYHSLYYPEDFPAIVGFEKLGNARIEVELSRSFSSRWTVRPDEGGLYESEGRNPVVLALPGIHWYEIATAGGAAPFSFRVRLQFVPSEEYRAAGLTLDDQFVMMESNIPACRFESYPLSSFVPNLASLSAEDRDTLDGALAEADLSPNDDSRTKVRKIGKLLLDQLGTARGCPSDVLQKATPMQAYRLAIQGESSIWCSHFASIYRLMATAAGMPTRLVIVTGWLDDVALSGHTFTETYLPETREWAIVDVYSGKLLITSQEGRPLNASQLLHVHQLGVLDGLRADVYDHGDVRTVAYAQVAAPERVFFTRDCFMTYPRNPVLPAAAARVLPLRVAKLAERLLNRTPTSAGNVANYKYYLVMVLFGVELAFLAGLGLMVIVPHHVKKALRRRRPQPVDTAPPNGEILAFKLDAARSGKAIHRRRGAQEPASGEAILAGEPAEARRRPIRSKTPRRKAA